MKIKEIITEIKKITGGAPATLVHDRMGNRFNTLGAGAYGSAYEVPRKQNEVVKVSDFNEHDKFQDGYYNFIKFIVEPNQNNRFLPKLTQEPKEVYPKKGQPYFVVYMEKLYSYDDLQDNQLPAMLNVLFKRYLTDEELVYINDNLQDVSFNYTTNTQTGAITFSKNFYIEALIEILQNPQLFSKGNLKLDTSEFNIIRQKLATLGRRFEFDLHDQNIMFRLTRLGPQIVVTDPFAEAKI